MRTTVEQRRRISRYFIIILFVGLVAGSLNTESHWPVFAAITGPADNPVPGGQVAAVAFTLRDVKPHGDLDVPSRLRMIARDSFSSPLRADQDRPPEVEPLEFVTAAAVPPASVAPRRGRPDAGAAGGGGCGGGRGDGFVPPGCLVREVAWTIKDKATKEEKIATAHSLRKVAGDAVAANGDARPAHLDRESTGGRPETGLTSRPDRPETADRPDTPKRPDRPEKADRPTRPDRPEKASRPHRPDRPDRPHRRGRDC